MRGLGVRRGSCRFREARDDQAEWEKAGSDWGNPTRPSLQNVLLHTASKLAAANLVDKSCETLTGNAKARIRALALYRLVDLANDLDLLAWMGEPAIWCRLCTAVH